MTPRPPQSEELKAQVTLASKQFLEAFIALMNDYGSRLNPDDQATLDITMSKFNDMATMMSDKMLALIAQRERATIRDFGEQVKATMETYDYQIGPEAYIELHEVIDQPMGEPHA